MPKFKVEDKVIVPADEECVEMAIKGVAGTIKEVRPGTGFEGKSPDIDGRLSEWSTPHMYVVDFGSPLGQQETPEELLELKLPG